MLFTSHSSKVEKSERDAYTTRSFSLSQGGGRERGREEYRNGGEEKDRWKSDSVKICGVPDAEEVAGAGVRVAQSTMPWFASKVS